MKKTWIVITMLMTGICYLHALDIIRLNFEELVEATGIEVDEINYNDPNSDGGGKWTQTYNDGIGDLVDYENFVFYHDKYVYNAGTDEMPYWHGFTYCTSGDDKDYGYYGSSQDWVTHQWGCMAGGGLNEAGEVEKGLPYLVGYWGYFLEQNNPEAREHSLQIDFADGDTHRPHGIWVCNHPWPYYGIVHGDGFAHGMADNGAVFNLIVHGLDEEWNEAGIPVVVTLAEFYDNELHNTSDWIWVDLTSLGQVNGLYFTMESYDDAGALGTNTATFFCLGGIEIYEHADELGRPIMQTAAPVDEHSVTISWRALSDADSYNLYVGDATHRNYVGNTTGTSYTFTGLDTYTSYHFYVQPVNEFEVGQDWGYLTARTLDLTPPTAPQNLKAFTHMYKIVLNWEAGTDNIAVEKYNVYMNGKKYLGTKNTSMSVTGLDADTEYTLVVKTVDTSGNESAEGATIVVSTRPELSYTREGLRVGNYGTICLPYDVADGEYDGAEFYKVVERNSEYITLEEVTSLNAGEAYFFRATETTLGVNYSGSSVAEPLTASANNVLQGSFTDNVDIPEGMWFLKNNQLYQSTGTQKVDAKRAYLTNITPAAVAPAPGRRRVTMPIHNVLTELDMTPAQQNKVQKLMIGEQIYILRDGHLYNMQGQILK